MLQSSGNKHAEPWKGEDQQSNHPTTDLDKSNIYHTTDSKLVGAKTKSAMRPIRKIAGDSSIDHSVMSHQNLLKMGNGLEN